MRYIEAPTDLVGCILWLDALDPLSFTLDATGGLSQWNDKSGLGNHATQATPANRPIYTATGFGGYPAFNWGSGTPVARGVTTAPITYGVFTAFFVMQGNAGSGFLYVHESDAAANREYLIGDPNPHMTVRRGGAQSSKQVTPLAPAFLRDGVRHIVTRAYGGTHASHLARQDRAYLQAVTFAAGDPGTATSTGPIYIGNRSNADAPHRGPIAEVILFNRVLSDGEIAVVEDFLSRKWDIALARDIAAPTDVSGCALWLDAQDGASVARDGSSKVSQWNDKSGLGNHATQATPANQPTYNAAGYLDWGASPPVGMSLVTPAISYGPFTAFFVVDGIAGGGYIYAHGAGANQDYTYRQTATFYVARAAVASGKNVAAGAGWYVGKHLLSRRFDGLNVGNIARSEGIILDAPNTGAGVNDPGTAQVSAAISIGGSGGEAFRGKFYEVIFYNRALTDGEMVAVELYLAHKWGFAAGDAIASPLDLSGCAMWFDASQGVAFDGEGVSQWNDSSGNARHIVQATPQRRPTFNAANPIMGGRPSVDWNTIAGTVYLQRETADNLSQPLTVITCGACANAGATNIGYFANVSGLDFSFQRLNGTRWQFFNGAGVASTCDPIAANEAFIASCVAVPTIRESYLGMNGRIENKGGGGIAQMSTLRLGSMYDPFGAQNWNGPIAEFIVYRRRLSDGEIAMIEQYLANKYDVPRMRSIDTPFDIPSCVLYLDAAVGFAVDGSQWTDQSAAANHFVATGNARPTAATLNGLPIVRLDGVDDTMRATANIVDNLTGSTIIAVCRKRAPAASLNKALFITQANALYIDAVNGSWGGHSGGAKPSGEVASTNVRIFSVRRGQSVVQGAYRVQANGTQKAIFTTGTNDLRATTDLSFATQNADVDIFAVLVYQRSLTDGELAQVEAYLNQRYSVYPVR